MPKRRRNSLPSTALVPYQPRPVTRRNSLPVTKRRRVYNSNVLDSVPNALGELPVWAAKQGGKWLAQQWNNYFHNIEEQRAGRMIAQSRITPNTKRKLAPTFGKLARGDISRGMSTGKYVGPFKRPGRIRRTPSKTALQRGFVTKTESYGNVEDDHCGYIVHSTIRFPQITETILAALLRKLFILAGCAPSTNHAEMNWNAPTVSSGANIVLRLRDADNDSYSEIVYDTIDNQSFADLLDVATVQTMRDAIGSFLFNSDARVEPVALFLYLFDANGATPGKRLASKMDLKSCVLHVNCWSKLKMQNRSKGADTSVSGLSADRVDNQPLQGYLYHFKGSVPKLKVEDTFPASSLLDNFNHIPETGVKSMTPATFVGTDGDFEEPPKPNIFANCTRVAKQLVQPGDIKVDFIKYKYVGRLQTLRKTMSQTPLTSLRFYDGWGRSSMIALEEMIRTPAGNKVALQYERSYCCSAVAKPKKTGGFHVKFDRDP